ncbi:hypothetical protein Y032_0001g377 [Ancylostoma ceylanicum]|uniref:Peptidase M13 N-terminal domain-containing protein n=1 Tax=Ancylostoma ceylanicum TaxID=53326 RepID=A0A016W3C1_9BILA|nr:hypothetical protein Y032_0001g377 [Ancylostoma ceylanicum]
MKRSRKHTSHATDLRVQYASAQPPTAVLFEATIFGELDAVNWTKYLLKTVPAIHHSYIINDPIVIAEKTQQKMINYILMSTPKKVIVNYAMLLYTLSWIEFMDEKYQKIVEALVQGNDDVCVRTTMLRFRETLTANYERRTSGNHTASNLVKQQPYPVAVLTVYLGTV